MTTPRFNAEPHVIFVSESYCSLYNELANSR